jgi:EmrB/QacA subfamily drug resistance transporter
VPTDRTRRLTLVATVLGSSLAFIDATVVNVALPAIERDLDLGLSGQEWVYLAYSLALAALYLTAGAVGDRWGRRPTFTWGVAGFAAASVLAGLAPSGAVLIAARLLQGIAGAFVTTNSLALLRAVYREQAGMAVGLWSSLTGFAMVIGPPAGGALVEWASWRWIFFLNLPLAATAVVLAHLGGGDDPVAERSGRLDVAGAVLVGVGFGALTYGVVEGSAQGFGSYWWAFALASAALVTFVGVELRTAEPLVPFRIFGRRNFRAANVETFLVYAALGGFFLFLPIYLQFVGFTPFQAGLVSVPMSVVMLLLAARFGALADRRGPRLFLAVGPAIFAGGMLLFLPVTTKQDFWIYGPAGIALLSLGLSVFVAPITATAISSAPEQYAGIAAGVNTTLSRLGGLLAVAVMGLTVSLVFTARGGPDRAVPLAVGQRSPQARSASVDAFRAGTLVAVALALAGAAVGGLGISNAEALGRSGESPEAPPESPALAEA